MRALVVAPQPFFTPRGTPLSVYYRTLITARLGVHLDLVTYGEGWDVDIEGVRIHRIPRFGFLGSVRPGPSLLKLWLDFFLFFRTIGLLLRHRYDFVHAHEESVFFLRYLKPLFGFKLVYDMHSSLPQQLQNFDFTRSRVLIGLFDYLERSSLARADAVITISPALYDYALSIQPDAGRHFLIENTIVEEVRLKNGTPANEAVAEREIPVPSGDPLILYAGTLESYQGIEMLLEAHARLLEERPDAFLLLLGGASAQVQAYRNSARRLGIEGRCRFTGAVAQSVARRMLERAAVIVSPRTTGNNTPLKVYEALASGVPLVASRVPSHTQVLDESVCFMAEPDADGLAAAILSALNEPERRREVTAKARALYESRYSEERYVGKMREMLEQMGLCVA
jgi:glycosyltransferase involved in cell wall biosynthesis